MIQEYCKGKPDNPTAGCGSPVAFVARRESEKVASVFVCGKHLAAALKDVPVSYLDRWIVTVVRR